MDSGSVAFVPFPADDGGSADANSQDSGSTDGGHLDSGLDSGAADAGRSDAGTGDAGPADLLTDQCLARPPAQMTKVTGIQTARVNFGYPLPDHTFDFRGLLNSESPIPTKYAITVGTGGDGTATRVCLIGGSVMGNIPRHFTRDQYYNSTYDGDALDFGVRSEWGFVNGLRADNVSDAFGTQGSPPARVILRNAYFTYIRDDCIENDSNPKDLTIVDSLLDGCYVGISERPGATNPWVRPPGDSAYTTLDGVLLYVKPMPTETTCRNPSQPCADGLGSHVFFKWDAQATPNVLIKDSVLRMDEESEWSTAPMEFPPGTRAMNSVLVWSGAGNYPHPLPAGMTVTRDMGVWDAARARWLVRHGCPPGGDITGTSCTKLTHPDL